MPVSASWFSGSFYIDLHLLLFKDIEDKWDFLHRAIKLGMCFSVCASKHACVRLQSLESAGLL